MAAQKLRASPSTRRSVSPNASLPHRPHQIVDNRSFQLAFWRRSPTTLEAPGRLEPFPPDLGHCDEGLLRRGAGAEGARAGFAGLALRARGRLDRSWATLFAALLATAQKPLVAMTQIRWKGL